MTELAEEAPTRRVRPWIAALLTFLGWGLGLYYARRTQAATRAAILQVVVGLALGVAVLVALYQDAPRVGSLLAPDRWSMADTLNVVLTALVAIWVWRATSQHQSVPKAGARRLLGYAAIWLTPLLTLLVLALLLRFFALQPFHQPSASMAPTLPVGQYFVVEKWSYGYGRYSFAPFEALGPRGRWLARAPERGDVIVFRPPHEPNRDFVKRIVGLPGDRVQVIGGILRINGVAVERRDMGETTLRYGADDVQRVRAFRETLPNGVTFTTFELGDSELDNTREVTVPAGHYFVMGDNRDMSDDTRRSIGFVPLDNIVGRVALSPR